MFNHYTPGAVADCRHRSPYGMVAISWELVDGELTVETELRTGTTGVLDLEGRAPEQLGPGRHRHTVPADHMLSGS